MRNHNLENLYHTMENVFTNLVCFTNYFMEISEKYRGLDEFELDEDDDDTIMLYCRKEFGNLCFDNKGNYVISVNEWEEFLNYSIQFVKNIIIKNLNK